MMKIIFFILTLMCTIVSIEASSRRQPVKQPTTPPPTPQSAKSNASVDSLTLSDDDEDETPIKIPRLVFNALQTVQARDVNSNLDAALKVAHDIIAQADKFKTLRPEEINSLISLQTSINGLLNRLPSHTVPITRSAPTEQIDSKSCE